MKYSTLYFIAVLGWIGTAALNILTLNYAAAFNAGCASFYCLIIGADMYTNEKQKS